MDRYVLLVAVLALAACAAPDPEAAPGVSAEADGGAGLIAPAPAGAPAPDFTLTADQTHARFSSTIAPVLRVPSGAVIEAFTEEASDGQLPPGTTSEAVRTLDFDPIHPLTGPVYVEGAKVGDVLAVTIHRIALTGAAWTAIVPGFGYLSDQFTEPYLHTFELEAGQKSVEYAGLTIPLRPFPGVMGVAPETAEMLSTVPPRENGGNMDNPHLVPGTTVYFPVFVEGALFSIGDGHAAQGMGEVSGTGIEAPMRVVYSVQVLPGDAGGGRSLREPEYETTDHYATTASAPTLDEAAKRATEYMVDYLEAERGLTRQQAYVLCSLAGDLQIAEVVDVPNVHVAMHMPKAVFE